MKTGMSGWVDLLFPLSKPSDQSLALFDAGFFAKACTNTAEIMGTFSKNAVKSAVKTL